MKSDLPDQNNCFICCKKPEAFINTSDFECHIICEHFWFEEDDVRSATICGICWEKVDQFHQFYLEVQKLHGQLDTLPLSVFIKQEQEETEIEADQLQEDCIDLPVDDDQKPFDAVDCKLEIPEERKKLSKEKLSSKPRKYPRKSTEERIDKRNNATSRKLLTPEERKAEDDFIKQHTLYSCEQCNIEFDSFIAIKRHQIKTHNKDSVVCCGNQHRTRALLYQHVQNVLNPEAFKCEICSITFKYENGFLRHNKEYHATGEKPVFKCHRCEKSYINEATLKSHLRAHETLDKETAKCEVCGKCFGHKLALRHHVKNIHQKSTHFDFICEICSKGFNQRSTFWTHLRRHKIKAEQIRKQCPVCNKWLKTYSYLRHVRSHEEEGQEYKCEMCAHVSRSLNALKMHTSRKHASDRKRYVCSLCDKEYSRPATLREHVANAHTGEPLYQCQYCEKKFFSNATMYSHRKKKHPQEWQKDQTAKYAPAESLADGTAETDS